MLVLRGVFGPNIQVYSVFSRQLWIEMTLNIVFVPFVFGLLNMFPTTFLYKRFSS
ncbi:rod shape-determining protein MreD [Treponema pallidum]|nr:rod shape-determining protein MreD [Treponema pallidum]